MVSCFEPKHIISVFFEAFRAVTKLLALLAETNFMLTRGLGTPSSAGSVIPSAEQSKVLPPIQYQSWIGLQYILPVTPKIQSGIGSTPQDPVRDS